MSVITDRKIEFSSQPSSPLALSDSMGPSQIPELSGLAFGWRRFLGYFQPSGPLDPSVGDDLTRKALKEPIAETAALAQKNSEATRALAAQEDILEKELGEIQKFLLAMQEQQQKQLELILAIVTSGKFRESRQVRNHEQSTTIVPNSSEEDSKQKEAHQI